MKRKLGELLIEAGAVTSDDVDVALSDQSAGEPARLGDLLLSSGKLSPAALARALAVQCQLPFADLSYVAPEASGLIPLEFQRAHRLVPFRLDKERGSERLHVALADPTLTDVVEELRSQLKRDIVVHVAPIDDIESVHAALAGEAGDPVVMGEVLEDDGEVFLAEAAPDADATREVAFAAGPATVEFAFSAADALGGDTAPFDLEAVAAAAAAVPDLWPPDAPEPWPTEPPPPPPPAIAAPAASPAAPRPASKAAPLPVAAPLVPAAEPAAAPASVSEEDLFGSLDLGTPAEVAPLTTDLADEIGRNDLAPPTQGFVGFSALSQPLGDAAEARASAPSVALPAPAPIPLVPEKPLVAADPSPPEPPPSAPLLEAQAADVAAASTLPPLPPVDVVPAPLISPLPDLEPSSYESTQKFAGSEPAPLPEVARIPSFAIAPDVPVEPRRSPAEPGRPAALGRVAARKGSAPRKPLPPPVDPEPFAARANEKEPDLALPDWMRSSSDPAPVLPPVPAALDAGELSARLTDLLARVETGDLPSGPALAALMRLLVERRVVDDAALTAILDKL